MKIPNEVKEIIERNTVAFATLKDNKPHCIAVADVKVVEDKILIGDNYMKTTTENIKKNKNVSLCVWQNDEGYRIDGEAEYFKEGKWLEMIKKIHKCYPAKGAIVIKVNEIRKLA